MWAVVVSQVFFDDSVQNISAAKQLGIKTVLVSTGWVWRGVFRGFGGFLSFKGF